MQTKEIVYRPALHADTAAAEKVLFQCGLRSEDICADETHYELAELGGRIIGIVGIENAGGDAVLLRSLAVLQEFRGQGIGAELMRRITGVAIKSATSMYLFSTEAGDYYRGLGYVEVPVEEVTAAVGQTPQVRKYEQLGWLPTEIAWKKGLAPFT